MTVEDRLRELRAPGEGEARRHAWELAAAEHAARGRRRRRRAPVLAAAAAVVALVGALSPPGDAVADWVEERVRAVVDDQPAPSRAAGLDELPGGGRILVLAADQRTLRDSPLPLTGSPWIVGERVHRPLLGAVNEATWSPRGRFVAATRGSELIAVDLRGRRRWSVAARATVRAPSWSPSGFRVAYVAGPELRVVAGDGTGDRRVADRRGVGGSTPAGRFVGDPAGSLRPVALTPAWRPGRRHVLAFARPRDVVVVDVDSGSVLWRRPHQGDLTGLAFSPDGARLLVAGRSELRLLSARTGATTRTERAPAESALLSATWSRDGQELAVRRRTRGRTQLVVGRDVLFTARELGPPAYSPDGRWVMTDWRDTGSWLFLPLDGGRPRLVSDVRSRFGGHVVTPAGWCCRP